MTSDTSIDAGGGAEKFRGHATAVVRPTLIVAVLSDTMTSGKCHSLVNRDAQQKSDSDVTDVEDIIDTTINAQSINVEFKICTNKSGNRTAESGWYQEYIGKPRCRRHPSITIVIKNLHYLNEVEVETVTAVAHILQYLNEVEVETVTTVANILRYLNEVEVEPITKVI